MQRLRVSSGKNLTLASSACGRVSLKRCRRSAAIRRSGSHRLRKPSRNWQKSRRRAASSCGRPSKGGSTYCVMRIPRNLRRFGPPDEKLQTTLETRLNENFGRVVEQLNKAYEVFGEMRT